MRQSDLTIAHNLLVDAIDVHGDNEDPVYRDHLEVEQDGSIVLYRRVRQHIGVHAEAGRFRLVEL